MDYELANELKKAGFPQGYELKYRYEGRYEADEDNGGVLYYPSLSELIEACGDKFDCLIRRHDGVWIAYGLSGGEYNLSVEGTTPLIAVTKLWLALNKK